MTLHELIGLPCGEGEIVSLCGSGGKTTVMCLLAEECRALAPTAMLTTTHVFPLTGANIRMLYPFDRDACRRAWGERKAVFTGIPCENGKIASPREEDTVFLLREARGVYIESDGSHGLPMKFPDREKEPVLRKEATHTVVIAGMSALHRPPQEIFHRLRLAREHMEIPEAPVTEELMAQVLWAGYGDLRPIYFLNQADTPALRESAERICFLLRSYGAASAAFGSAKEFFDR